MRIKILRGVMVAGQKVMPLTGPKDKKVDTVIDLQDKYAKPMIRNGRAELTSEKVTLKIKSPEDVQEAREEEIEDEKARKAAANK